MIIPSYSQIMYDFEQDMAPPGYAGGAIRLLLFLASMIPDADSNEKEYASNHKKSCQHG